MQDENGMFWVNSFCKIMPYLPTWPHRTLEKTIGKICMESQQPFPAVSIAVTQNLSDAGLTGRKGYSLVTEPGAELDRALGIRSLLDLELGKSGSFT